MKFVLNIATMNGFANFLNVIELLEKKVFFFWIRKILIGVVFTNKYYTDIFDVISN